ncbi:MAG: RNA 2',3'-cyclic phosphodiesterase [Gammaproteobacteria bacterium]
MPATADRAVQRLFFALWPHQALAERLFQATRALVGDAGSQAVALEDLHVTLAFLGAVDPQRRACCETAGAAVDAASFTLTLDRVGHWPGPQVLWLGSSRPPPALTRLVESLTGVLGACGHVPEPRGFQPHLTLARRVALWKPAPAPVPLHWRVDHLCLVASERGVAGARYRVLRRWPLRKDAAG